MIIRLYFIVCPIIGTITLSRKSMSIRSYYLDTKEELDPVFYFFPSLSWFNISSILIFPQ